jgi:hypothetical protein
MYFLSTKTEEAFYGCTICIVPATGSDWSKTRYLHPHYIPAREDEAIPGRFTIQSICVDKSSAVIRHKLSAVRNLFPNLAAITTYILFYLM